MCRSLAHNKLAIGITGVWCHEAVSDARSAGWRSIHVGSPSLLFVLATAIVKAGCVPVNPVIILSI